MAKMLFVVFSLIAFLWTPLSRADDAPTIAGKWHFVFNTEGGDRNIDAIFELNADKVTGKWDVSETKKDGDPVAGTFADKQMNLAFEVNSEIGPGTMKLKGKLDDDGSLSGDWAFSDYAGTFKATRMK